jgi:hypothetical protein
MLTNTCNASICRNCRFFQPEGHYHGCCDRLNVAVRGEWKTCTLALATFDSVSVD